VKSGTWTYRDQVAGVVASWVVVDLFVPLPVITRHLLVPLLLMLRQFLHQKQLWEYARPNVDPASCTTVASLPPTHPCSVIDVINVEMKIKKMLKDVKKKRGEDKKRL